MDIGYHGIPSPTTSTPYPTPPLVAISLGDYSGWLGITAVLQYWCSVIPVPLVLVYARTSGTGLPPDGGMRIYDPRLAIP